MNQTAFEVYMNPQFELAAELLIELIRLRMIHELRARSLWLLEKPFSRLVS